MDHQTLNDLRALEYRIARLDAALSAAGDRARAVEESTYQYTPPNTGGGLASIVVSCSSCGPYYDATGSYHAQGVPAPGALVLLYDYQGALAGTAVAGADGVAVLSYPPPDSVAIQYLLDTGTLIEDIPYAIDAYVLHGYAVAAAVPIIAAGPGYSLPATWAVGLGASLGYVTPPPIAFDPPPSGGSLAAGYSVLGLFGIGQLSGVTLTARGTDYDGPPAIAVGSDPAGGSGGAAAPIMGRLTGGTITAAGSGYPVGLFTVGIIGDGMPASISLGRDGSGRATSASVDLGGSGYSTAPTLTATAAMGYPPTLACSVSGGAVVDAWVVEPGSVPASRPITVTPSGGQGMGGIATIQGSSGGGLLSISGITAGSGFLVAPRVDWDGSGLPSTGSIALGYAPDEVGSVAITHGGYAAACVPGQGVIFPARITTPWGDFPPAPGAIVSGASIGSGFDFGPTFLVTAAGNTVDRDSATTVVASPTSTFHATFVLFAARRSAPALGVSLAGGQVAAITFDPADPRNFGYASVAQVTIAGVYGFGGGTAATAHATMTTPTGPDGASIATITLDYPGSNYSSAYASASPPDLYYAYLSCKVLAGVPPGGTLTPIAGVAPGGSIAVARASIVSTGPLTLAFDFSGTAADGVVFQGGNKGCTITGVS